MPTITLTTDYGLDNYLNAVSKGILLKVNSKATVIELSTSIDAFNILQSAYILKSSFHHFAKGTHHIVLSGLYNQNTNALLVTLYKGQFFYYLDNGLAPLLFEEDYLSNKITTDAKFIYNPTTIVEAFAIAIQAIEQKVELSTFTKPYNLQFIQREMTSVIKENEIITQVIYIDSFKNVVVNITEVEFKAAQKERNFTIGFIRNETINTISNNYRDVNIGRKLCFFNTAGYLEIAVRGGKASELFGFEIGDYANDVYKTVIIKFE